MLYCSPQNLVSILSSWKNVITQSFEDYYNIWYIQTHTRIKLLITIRSTLFSSSFFFSEYSSIDKNSFLMHVSINWFKLSSIKWEMADVEYYIYSSKSKVHFNKDHFKKRPGIMRNIWKAAKKVLFVKIFSSHLLCEVKMKYMHMKN